MPSESSSGDAGVATIRRINREIVEIQTNPSKHWVIESVGDNLLEWHFTIRGPPGTEFENGLYHGRLLLPFNYPFAPPSIMLLNTNGRFETNKKICLSISNYHPELWQPAWGIRTIMEGLRSFFPTPSDGAVGGLDWPADLRKKLAIESREWKCTVCEETNLELLPPLDGPEETTFEPPPFQLGATESPKVETAHAEVPVQSPRDSVAGSSSSAQVVIEQVPVHQPVAAEGLPAVVHTHTSKQNEKIIINSLIVFILGVMAALIIDIMIHPPSYN